MHAAKLLHDLLDNACQKIDKRLRKTLFEAADTLAHCKHLSIVSLGRHLYRKAKVKHTIKCMDRLFGNRALHQQTTIVYKGMTEHLIKKQIRPIILIDWSGLTPCGAFHFLRASIAINGRSLTLYDQAYSLREYDKEKTHELFLLNLKNILPENCKPIVVTDAGFRNTWFQAIRRLDWDFIGRVRSNTRYCMERDGIWQPIKSLYEHATLKAKHIGRVKVAQSRPLSCEFHLVRQSKKFRVKKNLVGKKVRCSSSLKHEKRENEPWLIATSLSIDEFNSNDIISLYKKRMQIEEAFRDLKNTRNGLGLRHCRSYQVDRLNVALLIASLSTLILWILGKAAIEKDLHYSFQTNTEKRTNVLSIVSIGWQVLIRNEYKFNRKELMSRLPSAAITACGRAL